MPARESRMAMRCGAAFVLALILAQGAPSQGGQPVIGNPRDITFELIAAAATTRTYEADQVRRFREANGNLIGVRERLLHSHDGSSESFRLDYLGMESGSPQAASTWQTTYARQSGLLYRHGSFSVHDPVAASRNYVIFWLGSTTRLSRPVERVVVFPRLLDRSIWVLDLDRETGLALYHAEFDTEARLVSELEVVALRLGNAVLLPERRWAWQPWMIVNDFQTFDEARLSLGSSGTAMLDPDTQRLPQGYALVGVRVVENPLNGNKNLVMIYGDGVDQFFVAQSQDNIHVFTGLPTASSGASRENTVAYFQDSSLSAFLFQEGAIRFMIVGRGALTGLKRTVESLYLQVLGR